MNAIQKVVRKSKSVKTAGYIVGIFGLLGFIVFVSGAETTVNRASGTFFYFLVLFVGIVLIFLSRKIRGRVERFQTYSALITHKQMVTVYDIAEQSGKSADFVKADLQKMIDNQFFINTYIDAQSGEIVTNKPVSVAREQVIQNAASEMKTVICSSCGAKNMTQTGQSHICDYCGSPL